MARLENAVESAVETKSHRIHYKTLGSERLPPLLILHGFLGDCDDFDGVLPLLSEYFYCILPDLPGHGKTVTIAPDRAGYGFDEVVRSLSSLLDDLSIDRASLLGYSMGGRIALYATIKQPSRFSQTILESASPGLRTRQEREARIAKDSAIARKLETIPFDTFLTNWYANPLFDSLHKHSSLFEDMLKRRRRNNPLLLAKALRGLSTGKQASMWPYLSRIKSPLLLMFGTEDKKFASISYEISHEMIKACEKNKKESVSLCPFLSLGHSIHLEVTQQSLKRYVEAVLKSARDD